MIKVGAGAKLSTWLFLLALLAAGCGGGDDTSEAETVVEQAIDEPLSAGAAEVELEATGALQFSGSLETDFEADESGGTATFAGIPGIPPDTAIDLYIEGPDVYGRFAPTPPG